MEETLEYNTDAIKDSGNRRKFESGAVRDIQEGKGRCDLLPLHEVARLIRNADDILMRDVAGLVVTYLAHAKDCLDGKDYDATKDWLYSALLEFRKGYSNTPDMILEVSKHFEEGAKKYGEYNWQKGIPYYSYIDSAVRHFLKCLGNYNDENHYRAFVWNVLALLWTINHHEELGL